MNATPSRLYNISPGKESWISAGSGVRGLAFNFAATADYCRAELYIDRGNKDENESIFDRLFADKQSIETELGHEIEWERLDAKRACRLKWQRQGDIFNREMWPEMIPVMVSAMLKFEEVLRPRILKIAR